MFKQHIFFVLLLAFYLSFNLVVTPVIALTTPPEFPSCVNPQGSIEANYSSGIHGIPGKTESFSGSDTVYKINSKTIVQCFCPDKAGSGIQTNWWKIPSLTGGEIENYKTQGWIFIPDGSAWGLDPATYLAKNSDYSCGGIGGIGGGEILGLATTGNIKTIYLLLGLGFISLIVSYLLKRKVIN